MKDLLGFMFLLMPVFFAVGWLGLTWLLWKGGRRFLRSEFVNSAVRVVLVVTIAALWFGGAFWMVLGKKIYWDAQVRELCAKDGGVKVYETVELPAEKFDKWGMVKFYQPVQKENALGSDYVLKRKATFFRKTEPTITRIHYLILRRSGEEMLGETIFYTRGGGDFPGPWEGSSYACPTYKDAGINQLIKTVFHKTKGG